MPKALGSKAFNRRALYILLPYLLLFLTTLLQHMMGSLYGDDIYFVDIGMPMPVLEFAQYRYRTWSSRFLIEAVLTLCVQNYSLWVVCNSLVWCLLAYGITRLFGRRTESAWLVAGMCAIIPPAAYNSAGLVSTEVNYIWPICMGVIAFLPFAHKPSRGLLARVLCSLALIFACNLEQLAPVVFTFYLLITIRQFRKKDKLRLYALLQTGLALAGIIYHLSCPGNAHRIVSDINRWFPDFGELSLLLKLEMGYSSTLYHYIMSPDLLFLVFTGLLAVCVCSRRKLLRQKLCACVPFAFCLVFGVLSDVFAGVLPNLSTFKNALQRYGTFPLIEDIYTWIPDIIIGAAFIMVLVSICIALKDNPNDMILALLLIMAGFCSRMIMSFMPVIWASGARTFLIMDFCIIACSLLIFDNLSGADNDKDYGMLNVAIACVSILAVLNNFASWRID